MYLHGDDVENGNIHDMKNLVPAFSILTKRLFRRSSSFFSAKQRLVNLLVPEVRGCFSRE